MNPESYLLPLGLLAVASLAFLLHSLWKKHNARVAFGCFLLIGGLFVVGVARVLDSTPGGIDVIDESDGDDLFPPIVTDDELDSLREPWDSESVANWQVAPLMSRLSDIAYRPPVLATEEFREIGFDEVIPVSSATMFGYVVIGPDVAVVAFRGSEKEAGDWWTNLSRSPLTLSAGEVHSGFWNGYQSMKSQIELALDRANARQVWVTGHSLGGALAVCCAYDLDLSEQPIAGVITFGQPMVARESLADDIDDRLLGRYARFVNRNDVVARIPPSYRPAGSLVWFTDNGIKRSKPKRAMFGSPFSEEPGLKRSAEQYAEPVPLSEAEFQQWMASQSSPPVVRNEKGEILLQGNSPYFADHSIELYVAEVESLIQGSRGDDSIDDLFGAPLE